MRKTKMGNQGKTRKPRILFIGNSHTYYNDMPELVRQRATQDGFDCEVTMLAHGGWFLEQHAAEPDVRFNIRYGHYDYVVLQETAHIHRLPDQTLRQTISGKRF